MFERYQDRLSEAALEDGEGRLALARDVLRRKQTTSLRQIGVMVVDGFAEFSAVEHDILALLARRAETVFLSLPGEQPPGRDDLFAGARLTQAELRSRHPRVTAEYLPTTETWAAKDHLLRNLFRDLHRLEPVSDAARESLASVEILAASSVDGNWKRSLDG